jgi:hypothetical protein
MPKTIGQRLAKSRNKKVKDKVREVEKEEPDSIDPMVVNDEETQQKRSYESDDDNPKKKNRKERQFINQMYSERRNKERRN